MELSLQELESLRETVSGVSAELLAAAKALSEPALVGQAAA
jgi:hypothetical protein